MRVVRFMIVFLGSALFAAAGHGAGALDAELPESIRDLVCYDNNGRRVEVKSSATLTDIAQTVVLDGTPYIVVSPRHYKELPPKLQVFFFEHECAHHLLGHLQNSNFWSETEADCLAIKMGRDRGAFTRADVLSFRPYIRQLQGTLRGHLPGWRRFGFLFRCYEDGVDGAYVSARLRAALDAASRFRQFARGGRRR